MSRPTKLRLFIALDLPSALCQDLAAWTRSAVGAALRSGSVRAIAPEAMHVTLCFLGSRPVDQIEPLAELVEEHAPPSEQATLGAPLWLPPRRPRVLAVEVHDPAEALRRLYRALLEALAVAGLEGQEGASRTPRPATAARTFKPHVTVARMRAGAAPRERVLPVTPQRSFCAPRLVLYRSRLDRAGATYEALAESALAGSAALG
jgi:2'-5' RNA ligase